jgi:hypothetical protein
MGTERGKKKTATKAAKKKAGRKKTGPASRSLRASTRTAVLMEAGYRCANPRCRDILVLELHHIEWVKDGGGNEPRNLVCLCSTCHKLHTMGHIPKSAILAWKAVLESLNNPHRGAVDLLLVLAGDEDGKRQSTDHGTPPFRFTGDSLASLAPLLTSGTLEISRRFLGATMWGGAHPSFEVRLTERGRRLVAAWREGNPTKVKEAVHHVLEAESGSVGIHGGEMTFERSHSDSSTNTAR